jgi:hypothetical protein
MVPPPLLSFLAWKEHVREAIQTEMGKQDDGNNSSLGGSGCNRITVVLTYKYL